MAKRGRPRKNTPDFDAADVVFKPVTSIDAEGAIIGNEDGPIIIVENQRQKRRMEPPLSQRRIIKDSYKENRAKRDDSVHFNFGFLPGNSYRCLDCREGFVVFEGMGLACIECGSTNLVPHSTDFVR